MFALAMRHDRTVNKAVLWEDRCPRFCGTDCLCGGVEEGGIGPVVEHVEQPKAVGMGPKLETTGPLIASFTLKGFNLVYDRR